LSGKVVVIMGYGCHLTAVVRAYLDKAVKAIAADDIVIATGGFTNAISAPGVSEAMVIADYLVGQGLRNQIITEETARTTNENLQQTARLLKKLGWRGRITICCDYYMQIKVRILERFILGLWPQVVTYRIVRGAWPIIRQLCFATPIDLLMLVFPGLGKLEARIVARTRIKNG
jgi:uncharacterized SAM-binding protein YcdF (DUF218 family)